MHAFSNFRRQIAMGGAVLVAAVVLTGPAAHAAPTGPGPARGSGPASGPVDARPRVGGAGPVRVTLVTGDVATYTVTKGHAAATLRPATGRGTISFRTSTENGGYYLFPSDVLLHVQAGLLDKELFNLRYLAENGYTDDRQGQLPLIVQYQRRAPAATLRGQAAGLSGQTASAVTSINGAAVKVDKRRAVQFWRQIRGTAAGLDPAGAARPGARPRAGSVLPTPSGEARLAAGLRKVWLDAKVTARDEGSNAQIGAPTAWGAGLTGTGVDVGIIDTGIDATHPDLTGRIVTSRNFVAGGDPGDATDRNGHGTHVAGIVTGSGAASAGRHQGVAHGSRLIIAKALDDSGRGPESQILAAMEWMAAEQRARVVSMSLGAPGTDGTDPLSMAADNLTARHGTLFVIAAGNSGPLPNSVETPGTATSALTVGAVDSNDQLAIFSSRGPRLGDDFAVKPEITAPGVDIISARAAGTSLGSPVDDRYTRLSGTSMATPHVAGAAAILAQQHQDWTPAQLKNALVGAAKDGGFTAYEQGAGRLDVARAVTQKVTHDTPSIHAGFPPPWNQPLTRRVTFRNDGSAPVTLNTSTALSLLGDGTSTPAPDGMIAVNPASVTVPAGGTAPVDVTIDPSVGPSGAYEGRVLATSAGGDRLTVPIGFRKIGPRRDLTVRLDASSLPLDFQFPNFNPHLMSTVRVNDNDPDFLGEPLVSIDFTWQATDEPGVFEITRSLPEGGIYTVESQFDWWDWADGRQNYAWLGDPEVRLDTDRTVTFDLAELAKVDVRTPRPSEPVLVNYMASRVLASGLESSSGLLTSYSPAALGTFWASRTAKPTVGSFLYLFDVMRPEPEVGATLHGDRPVALHPRYALDQNLVPKFTSDRKGVGLVSAAELRAGKDVRNKLVLLDPAPFDQPELEAAFHTALRLAIQRGAAGVLTDALSAWTVFVEPAENRIPVLWVDRAEAARARAALAAAGSRSRVDLRAAANPGYQYKLVFYQRDRIPAKLDFAPGKRDLATMHATYHGHGPRARLAFGPAPDVSEVDHTVAPGQTISIRAARTFAGRVDRTEYYNITGRDVLWLRENIFFAPPGGNDRIVDSYRAFTRATESREDWNETTLPTQFVPGPNAPARFAPFGVFTCDSCRQGDRLRLRTLGSFGGDNAEAGDPSHVVVNNRQRDGTGSEETHLFAGGQEIQPKHDAGPPYYELPAQAATYRLTSVFRQGFSAPHTGDTITTSWTFRSQRPTTGTVAAPFDCVDTALFGDAQPCAFQPLVYLRYDFGLAPDDTAPAGKPFTFTIAGMGNPPTGTRQLHDLSVWTSTDGGTTWTPARVTGGPGNTHRVDVHNPTGTSATVSIRTRARDRDGATIEQTIDNAYLLE